VTTCANLENILACTGICIKQSGYHIIFATVFFSKMPALFL